jgi:hypothetical protein
MTDPVAQGARAAARRLGGADEQLAHDVELALHARGADRRPQQYTDPAALGSLVVSVAAFAWTAYTELRGEDGGPDAGFVGQRVRQELQRAGTPVPPLDTPTRDRIVDVAVEETLRAAREAGPAGRA